jgi:hypothetical protein
MGLATVKHMFLCALKTGRPGLLGSKGVGCAAFLQLITPKEKALFNGQMRSKKDALCGCSPL